MGLNSIKFVAHYINVSLNPLMISLEEEIVSRGIWEDGVYSFQKKKIRINPLERFLKEFRREATKKEYLDSLDTVFYMDKLVSRMSCLVLEIPDKGDLIQQKLNEICKKLSKYYKDSSPEITFKIFNCNHYLFNVQITISESLNGTPIILLNGFKQSKLKLPPKVYYINATKRFLLFPLRSVSTPMSLFCDRKLTIDFKPEI